MRCFAPALLLALALTPARGQDFPLDPARSRLTYAMRHPFVAWEGTSRAVSGFVSVADGRVTGGRVAAPVRSFDSGVRGRDSDMLRAVDAARFPDVTFEVRTVSHLPPARHADDRNAFVAGTLTFHGVAQALTLPVLLTATPDGHRVRGTFAIEPTAFGVDPPSIVLIPAEDRLTLTFDLFAPR